MHGRRECNRRRSTPVALRILADVDRAGNGSLPRQRHPRGRVADLQRARQQAARSPALRASARRMQMAHGRCAPRARWRALRMFGARLGGDFDRVGSRMRRQRLQWNLVRRFDRVLVELVVGVISAGTPSVRPARRCGVSGDRSAARQRRSAHRSLPSGASSLSASGPSSPPGSSGRASIGSSSERSQREPRVELRSLDESC